MPTFLINDLSIHIQVSLRLLPLTSIAIAGKSITNNCSMTHTTHPILLINNYLRLLAFAPIVCI